MQRPTLIISSAARSPYRAPAPNADSPCTSIKVRTPSASTHACAKPREAAIGAASKAIRLAPGSIIKLNRTFGHQDCRSDRHRRDALRQLHACGRRPPLPSNAALARGGAARSAHCGKQRTALRVRPGQRRPPAQQRGAHARSRTAPSSALYPASSPGSAGARPRSVSTRCAQPKPEKTTAFTPWPGNVLSPTQYRPCAPPEARQATDTLLCSQGARRAMWLDMIQGATSPRTKNTPTRAAVLQMPSRTHGSQAGPRPCQATDKLLSGRRIELCGFSADADPGLSIAVSVLILLACGWTRSKERPVRVPHTVTRAASAADAFCADTRAAAGRGLQRALTAVRLKGMPSMPSGRRAGMGPYEPSRLFRKRRCVRGVPTCRQGAQVLAGALLPAPALLLDSRRCSSHCACLRHGDGTRDT